MFQVGDIHRLLFLFYIFALKLLQMEDILIDSLKKRYATKRFNPDKKLSQKQLDTLIESVRLTATSYGLQLMKLVVVEDQNLKTELMSHSYDQTQVRDASHLFVLCREKSLSEDHFETHVGNISEARSIDRSKLDQAKSNMMNSILGMSVEDQEVWMEKQVYIALGNLLVSCAMIGVDSCPMEGFKPSEYDRILELDKENLVSVLVVPVGFRSDDDSYATAQKVRRSSEQLVINK